MRKENIGIVAPGSSRRQIIMYSRENISTDYIMTEDDKNRYIFEVTSIETMNEKLKDIEYYRIMIDEDNYSKYNIFRIEAQYIGALDLLSKNIINDIYYIATPGTNIYTATNEDISIIYDISKGDKRIKIGRLFGYDSVPVSLDFNQLFSTHASILGRTGSGKTFFIKKLLEILEAKYIVISPTDEYNFLVNSANLFDSGNIPINIDISKCKNAFELNPTEERFLKHYCELNNKKGYISSNELSESIYLFHQTINGNNQRSLFIDEIDNKNIEIPRYVLTLCEKLSQVDLKINLNKERTPDSFPIVFSTQELSEKIENIAVHSLLSTILSSRISKFMNSAKKMDDILIILEEAHNYAPSIKTTKCKDIIVQIARVGRKYGLHLLILSQRPRFIDQTLLSQCGTNFIFNLPNPQDIDYIMEHSYFYNERNKKIIQNLKTGECFITSNTRNNDVICKISL